MTAPSTEPARSALYICGELVVATTRTAPLSMPNAFIMALNTSSFSGNARRRAMMILALRSFADLMLAPLRTTSERKLGWPMTTSRSGIRFLNR